jgi:hypothetical protein
LSDRIPFRLLKQSERYSPEQYQNQSRTGKSTQPDKVLYRSWMSFAAREVQTQLTKCSQVGVEKQTWSLPDRDPKHAGSKPNLGQAI